MTTEKPQAVSMAVLTVTDSRTVDNDTSGDLLVDSATLAGHRIVDRALVPDDAGKIQSVVQRWIQDSRIQVVLTTGGTGITGRDITPDAVSRLIDRPIDGFGELFRMLSYQDIGAATIQSRALGGIANGTLLFCLPGSTGACRLAWDKILAPQLDSRTRPCNFVMLLPRLSE